MARVETDPAASPAWRNRIVGHGEEAPDQLLANPSNWRLHPKAQQDALAGVLDEVGWVQDVIVNQQTGFVVDGHLRVSLAISRGEPKIPVVYADHLPRGSHAGRCYHRSPEGGRHGLDSPGESNRRRAPDGARFVFVAVRDG